MRPIISFVSEKAILLSHRRAEKRARLDRLTSSNKNVTVRGYFWCPLSAPVGLAALQGVKGPSGVGGSRLSVARGQPKVRDIPSPSQ